MINKELLSEFRGTFILVLFGCSSVAGAVLFNAFTSLFEVAMIWGLGVALGIFASRNHGPTHLNPAVSIAMALDKNLAWNKVPKYVLSQFLGAMVAGLSVYLIFNSAIELFEIKHEIIRGSIDSDATAMIFGEFFPNPGFKEAIKINWLSAFAMEMLGTFILVYSIFKLTEKKEQLDNLTVLFIGLTVTLIICLVAPFTQAGLNPARDFGPRIIASLTGWGQAAFCQSILHSLLVYVLAPISGGILAVFAKRM